MANDTNRTDARLDLTLTRTIDAPRALIWQVWTDPEHVKKWWAPKPWTTVACELDLRPGGIFRTVMRSPEGQDYPHVGCFLELVKNEKMVWTNVLGPGYRPAVGESGLDCDMPFTAILTLEEQAGKTKYFVRVLHRDEAGRKKHEEIGFNLGWNQCLDQLIELVGQLKR
jgi:uncharacterized protein YndB with AHSA1/START domain